MSEKCSEFMKNLFDNFRLDSFIRDEKTHVDIKLSDLKVGVWVDVKAVL
jgi:hypothetical protein